jgi:hypothetical protein
LNTGDGFLAFSSLLASSLINVSVFTRAAYDRGMPYYEVTLSEQAMMRAWKEGNAAALPSADTTGA